MGDKMKAAVLVDEGNLQVLSVEKPKIKNSNDILIQVECCAICGSDVSAISVPRRHPVTYNTIIGHEYVGKIVEMGDSVSGFSIGERVVVEPNIACGKCAMCKNGHTNMCPNIKLTGFHYNGGMAEFSVMPDTQVHKIRDQSVQAKRVVLTEPLACVISSLAKLKIQIGDYCVVLGAGPIGLMYTELLKAYGAGKVIVSVRSARHKSAVEALGAIVVDPGKDNLNEFVKAQTDGLGADIVIDCVGGLMTDAVSCCAVGGQVMLFGLNEAKENHLIPFDLTRREISVAGSYITKKSFPRAIRVIEDGVVKLDKIVTHIFDLENIQSGFQAIKNGEAIKVVIQCHK